MLDPLHAQMPEIPGGNFIGIQFQSRFFKSFHGFHHRAATPVFYYVIVQREQCQNTTFVSFGSNIGDPIYVTSFIVDGHTEKNQHFVRNDLFNRFSTFFNQIVVLSPRLTFSAGETILIEACHIGLRFVKHIRKFSSRKYLFCREYLRIFQQLVKVFNACPIMLGVVNIKFAFSQGQSQKQPEHHSHKLRPFFIVSPHWPYKWKFCPNRHFFIQPGISQTPSVDDNFSRHIVKEPLFRLVHE